MENNQSTQTQQSLNFAPPKSLALAMGEIQQYYLSEQKAPLAKDAFTIIHFMAFSRAAVHSAAIDVLLLFAGVFVGALIYYFQGSCISETTTDILFWQFQGSPIYLMAKISSYGGLLYSTALCLMMARLSIGNFCRRAVNTMYFTRMVFLLSFGLLSFFVLGVIYRNVLTEKGVYDFCAFFAKQHPEFASKLFKFLFLYLRRMLFETSIAILIASAVAVVIPFLYKTVYDFFTPGDKELSFRK